MLPGMLLHVSKRLLMDSAALRFIPVERLEEEGYGQYLALFRPAPK
jgi:hypothetical protein